MDENGEIVDIIRCCFLNCILLLFSYSIGLTCDADLAMEDALVYRLFISFCTQ